MYPTKRYQKEHPHWRWYPIFHTFEDGRWYKVDFDDYGNYGGWRNLLSEFTWLLRYGEFNGMWQWPFIFGIGRTWYDGPIWFIHAGFFSVDLSAK